MTAYSCMRNPSQIQVDSNVTVEEVLVQLKNILENRYQMQLPEVSLFLCVFFVLKLVLKLSLAVISQLIGLLISCLPSTANFYYPNREMWLWHAQNGSAAARYQKIFSASNRKHSVFVLHVLNTEETQIEYLFYIKNP